MPSRYFIAVGASEARQDAVRRQASAIPGFSVILDRPGLIAAVDDDMPRVPFGDRGFVLGIAHSIGRRDTMTSLSADAVATILGSRGDHLVRAFWGDYVAFYIDPASGYVDIVRAPLGALPCFYADGIEARVAASDIELLTVLGGVKTAIDWDAVVRFAYAPDVRAHETCLDGIDEVRGGERITLGPPAIGQHELWTPWRFAAANSQLNDEGEAVRRLHDTILSSIGSISTRNERSLILLSGGLDSSIVAAGVAASVSDAQCVTVSTRAASGDERMFARKTAEHTGLTLHESWFDLAGVDLAASGAAHLPRPVARAFEYEARRQAKLVAATIGADALFSGGGGDNIFCSLQSVAPAVDALVSFDDRREFWRVTGELSELTGASALRIALRAWRRSWQPARPYPKPIEPQFLHRSTMPLAMEMPRHPWLQRPADIPQGKGAHVAAMLGVQTLTEDTDPRDPLCLRFPLLAQPIVETCLRIPAWLWYDRGCNRAVARRAFTAHLPSDIAWRRSKGTPDGFVVELFDARRAQIREMLCNGNLAGRGLLDLPALTSVLDDPRPVRGTDHGRVMRLLDIEAWTRCWPA